MEEMLADDEFWNNPKSKGLTRAAGALTLALVYDLCHAAWPAERNARVSAELFKMAKELNQSMGDGANTRNGNNWQAVRYGTVVVAAMASDEPGNRELAVKGYKGLLRHLRANLGGGIWNPEGIGYLTYPWGFTGPAGVVALRADIGDLRKDMPQTRETLWTQYVGNVPIPSTEGDVGLYPDLSDDNPRYSSRGIAGLAFHYLPDDLLGVGRYAYDMLFPGEKFDTTWGGGLYTLLFYPLDIPPVNPAEIGRLNFRDPVQGLAVFRNRWRDAQDVVALVNASGRRADGGHSGPDVNTFRILGLGGYFVTGAGRTGHTAGQTNLFADLEPPARGTNDLGKLLSVEFNETGGGQAVLRGSSMGVEDHVRIFQADYSGGTGFPAVFLNAESSLNGRLWRLNTPEFNQVEIAGNQFFLTAPNGAVLRGMVLEPAAVTIRTGSVERGGGAEHSGFPYRGQKYIRNTFLEFEVDGRAAVVFTLSEKKPGQVEIQHGLHGAEVTLGDQVVYYDRNQAELGKVAQGEQSDLLQRKEPLPVRHLQAEVRGDREVRLRWIAGQLQAGRLLLERRPEAAQDWEQVAALEPDQDVYRDAGLSPNSAYRYRVVAENAYGRAVPSNEVSLISWPEGMVERVEDFAAGEVPTAHRLGKWHAVESPEPAFAWQAEEGAESEADTKAGYWAVGSVPIAQSRVLLTEDIRMDLSEPGSQIAFDMKAQATTVFSPIFKLADGRWVMAGRSYASSRHRWHTLVFDLHHPKLGWWQVYPEGLRREQQRLEGFDPAMALQDVRGIGIFMEWVINRKFVNLDQLRVRGKAFDLN